MALIKCPECKKKISDQCGKCPNCGFPIETAEAPEKTLNNEVVENEVVIEQKPNKPKKERKPINKKILIGIISAAVILLSVGGVLGYNALLPRINATKAFNEAVNFVEQKNKELENEISESEKLIAKKQPLLDEALISSLENAISDAKSVKITDLETPNKVENIISRTEELNKTDYSEAITNLNNKHTALEINAKRYQLVNAPTEAYIIQCLKTIPEITGTSAVTEDNDPNGNLNKAGGYTSTVYFSHKSVNQKDVYGDTLIEKGTDAGGAIEVYTCVEDAIKRRDYLAAFDGSILVSGTHTVVGTVLVRTSNELTATQQKELETKIIYALTYIEEFDSNKESTTEEKTEETKQNTNESKPAENKPQNQENNNSITNVSEKIRYEGGICTKINVYGDGMPLDHNTEFVDGDNIILAGRFVGSTKKFNYHIKWIFPNGEILERTIENESCGIVSNIGYSDVGVGYGSVTITLVDTGEILLFDEFMVYENEIPTALEPADAALVLYNDGYTRDEIIEYFINGGFSRENAEEIVNDCGIQ